MTSTTLASITTALRHAFGPGAAEARVRVGRTENLYRSPYMTGLLVYAEDGRLLAPTYAYVHELAQEEPIETDDGVLPLETEAIYGQAVGSVRRNSELTEELFCNQERAPYFEVNDLLCSGPGLVPPGEWITVILAEAL
ncbi:hypothetical protein [Deinococcus navajonensis]|uniref:ASCH domain-containing protein n=1 Tax=Deinococcus navajonensis TaxID=309884 RepID=A0ABV8XJQ1_9DEIO